MLFRSFLSKKSMLKDAVFGETREQAPKNDGSMSFGEWIFTFIFMICLVLFSPVVILIKFFPWGLPILYLAYLASFIRLVVRQSKSNNNIGIKKFFLEVHLGSVVFAPLILFGGMILLETSGFHGYWQINDELLVLLIVAILSLALGVAISSFIHKHHIKVIDKREKENMHNKMTGNE